MHRLTLIAILCLTGGLIANPIKESCPDGWTTLSGHCYHYDSTPTDFVTAEAECIAKGGNLVSIHDNQQMQAIVKYVSRVHQTGKHLWTGGYDAIQEDVWMWTDGSSFDFRRWGTTEPNNVNGREHCMAIYLPRESFFDYSCEVKYPYLCSKNQ